MADESENNEEPPALVNAVLGSPDTRKPITFEEFEREHSGDEAFNGFTNRLSKWVKEVFRPSDPGSVPFSWLGFGIHDTVIVPQILYCIPLIQI